MIIRIVLNKKKYDINGNGIYNITIQLVSDNKVVNITEEFATLTARNKVLKNNTINVKGYKHVITTDINKMIDNKYGNVKKEVVEKYHK